MGTLGVDGLRRAVWLHMSRMSHMSRMPLRRATRLSTPRRLIGVATVASLLLVVGSVWAILPMLASATTAGEQVRRDDAVLVQLRELHGALDQWQIAFVSAVPAAGAVDVRVVTEGVVLGQRVLDIAAPTADALAMMGLTGSSGKLATAATTFEEAVVAVRPFIAVAPEPGAFDLLVAGERDAYMQLSDAIETAGTELREIRDLRQEQAARHLDNARTAVLFVAASAAVVIAFAGIVSGRKAGLTGRADSAADRRRRFESSLQNGLEMARTETAVYGIVNRALHDIVADLQVELLVADSSRAHFHRSLDTGERADEERSGCGVVSPTECPAAERSDTIVFPTSNAIDACPYLQDRSSGPCSAVCVPVNISGQAVGVLHATGVDHHPPDETQIGYLDATIRRAAERVTMLRAFEKSETRASTDPLTGLLNRRSLENQVRDLQRDGIDYVVGYGDLDHFKVLNDTHGHEAGDQALRLFSRVVRDSVRPNDIAARYGGEEFVIVLPDCDTNTATIVLERVREHLALALTTGRVPAFTVSFGVASSTDADTFDQIVAQADHSLLAAKTAGRNRVLVATRPTEPIQPEVPT